MTPPIATATNTVAHTALSSKSQSQDQEHTPPSNNDDAMSFQQLVDLGQTHTAHGVGRMSSVVFESGSGSYVTCASGARYLDLTCGIGVTNLGHSHPAITSAVISQLSKITHAQANIGFNATQIRLIRQLLKIMPHPSLDTFFFWNSGAEAVEASIKLARHATGRQNIIVMQGSYHGRTMGTMALTKSKTIYGAGYGPWMPGVFVTPFPYWSQLAVAKDTPQQEMVEYCLYQLELLLKQQVAPTDTAAILLEPVLGEGGYVPAPAAFLNGLRKVCDQHSILLICDEVQTGFGRTGTMWAVEESGVRPDILVSAKGLANGLPLSFIASSKNLMDRQPSGSQGGTYSGNALACAAAIAVLETFERERVLENAKARSEELFAFLEGLKRKEEFEGVIEEIRGRGLMVGLQFANVGQVATSSASDNVAVRRKTFDVQSGGGKAMLGPQVVQACLKKKMLLLSTSVYDTLRFIPPLTISQEELQEGCRIFEDSLREVVSAQRQQHQQ